MSSTWIGTFGATFALIIAHAAVLRGALKLLDLGGDRARFSWAFLVALGHWGAITSLSATVELPTPMLLAAGAASQVAGYCFGFGLRLGDALFMFLILHLVALTVGGTLFLLVASPMVVLAFAAAVLVGAVIRWSGKSDLSARLGGVGRGAGAAGPTGR